MKLIAFTDLHANFDVLERIGKRVKQYNPDFLVSSGDLSNFGSSLSEVLITLNDFDKKVFLVPGNHESNEEIREIVKEENLKNIKLITNRFSTFKNLLFYGYSGCYFSRTDKTLEKKIPKLLERLKKYKGKEFIFVTHAPPFGTEVSLIWEDDEGCYSIREFILKMKPKLTVCGHFHNNFYVKDVLNETLIVNPGPEGTLIDLENMKVKFLFHEEFS